MTKAKKRRGSSNAGRPRKEGPRLPNGRLAPPGPNERVVEMRRALLGDPELDIATASDPLDFAYAKGFLSLHHYRAALMVGETYARTKLGAPGMGRGGPAETATTVRDDDQPIGAVASRNQWDRMSRKEIAAAFDQVFNVPDHGDADERAAKALKRWKALNAAMTSEERDEVFSVCVLRSWPQWIIWRARGKDVPEAWDRKRRALESGLEHALTALRPKRAA